MKRFQFRLASVLRLKEQRERQAELVQKRAAMELEQARGEVAELHERLAEAAAGMERGVGQPVPIDAWQNRYHNAVQIGRAIEAAELRVQQAERRLAEATAHRARLATEVEVLRELRKRRRQEFRDAEEAIRQEEMDEFGLRRWRHTQDAEPEGPSREKE